MMKILCIELFVEYRENKIADALSRGQFQRFREVLKCAEERPHQKPQEFLELLI
jgi:hypothetical protein